MFRSIRILCDLCNLLGRIILYKPVKIFTKMISKGKTSNLQVDVLMSSDIVSAQMSTKPISFHQAYEGWVFKHLKEVREDLLFKYLEKNKNSVFTSCFSLAVSFF